MDQSNNLQVPAFLKRLKHLRGNDNPIKVADRTCAIQIMVVAQFNSESVVS